MSLSTLSSQLPTRPKAVPVQGKPVDIGGYYQPEEAKAAAALRPSATFNQILATL